MTTDDAAGRTPIKRLSRAEAVAVTAPFVAPTRLQLALRPWWRRLREYLLLTRMHRPIGALLLLWPTLWALWIAGAGVPDPKILLIFVLGTFVTRSAGCVINDFADRDFDPHVRRTRERPLAARRVSPYEALGLFVVLMLVAFALVLQLDALTIRLSLVGAALAITYPFFKRFFPAPQLYLGMAFGWGVPMAFAAQLGEVSRLGWLVFLVAITWAGVYDTLYAMVDRDDDRLIGIRSTAILFGDMDRAAIGVMQLIMLGGLALVGQDLGFGVPTGPASHRGAAVRLAAVARARTQARCVFRGVPQQQLRGPGDLRRHRGRIRAARLTARQCSGPALGRVRSNERHHSLDWTRT